MAKKKKNIEESLKNSLNDFMSKYGIDAIDFGSHKLKRKKPAKNKCKDCGCAIAANETHCGECSVEDDSDYLNG